MQDGFFLGSAVGNIDVDALAAADGGSLDYGTDCLGNASVASDDHTHIFRRNAQGKSHGILGFLARDGNLIRMIHDSGSYVAECRLKFCHRVYPEGIRR